VYNERGTEAILGDQSSQSLYGKGGES
jgi:hypothetical protein